MPSIKAGEFAEDKRTPGESPELVGVGEWNTAADANVFGRVLLKEVADDPAESTEKEPEDKVARGEELPGDRMEAACESDGKGKHRAQLTHGEDRHER